MYSLIILYDNVIEDIYNIDSLDMCMTYFAYYTNDVSKRGTPLVEEAVFQEYQTNIEKLAMELGHDVLADLKWLSWYLERCCVGSVDDLTPDIRRKLEGYDIVEVYIWCEEDQADDQSGVINDDRCCGVVVKRK